MSSPGRIDPEPTSRKDKNYLASILLLSILIGMALAGAWWYYAPKEKTADGQTSQVAQPVATNADAGPDGQNPRPKSKPSLDQVRPDKEIAPGQGEKTKTSSLSPNADTVVPDRHDCHQLARRLHGFFTHLDSQPYIQKALPGHHAQDYFLGLAHKLLNQPPVVSRETDDLYTMLKNMAHFFRVIGGKNIALIKTILSRERDTIEDVIGDFHQWATGPRCEDAAFPFHPPLDKMYEYAGFFLNSLGGRSYLFRRDSRSRLLVNYYSILVVDLANDKGLNRHGIDLRPLIPLTIDEIENTTQLIYKERYLETLYRLEKKYPRLQGDMDTVPILK